MFSLIIPFACSRVGSDDTHPPLYWESQHCDICAHPKKPVACPRPWCSKVGVSLLYGQLLREPQMHNLSVHVNVVTVNTASSRSRSRLSYMDKTQIATFCYSCSHSILWRTSSAINKLAKKKKKIKLDIQVDLHWFIKFNIFVCFVCFKLLLDLCIYIFIYIY